MEGKIKIEEYKVHCIIGVHPSEKLEEQEICIDLDLTTDFSKCIESDSVFDTLDYVQVGKICQELARSKHYHLLETYAYELLETLFARFSVLNRVLVRVKKGGALPLARCAAVELEKRR